MSPPEFRIRQARWPEDRDRIARLREQVFVHEQGVPLSMEWDGLDATALHWLATDRSGQTIGTARLLPTGQIGRMAVDIGHRRQGVGRTLLTEILNHAKALGYPEVYLNAQISVMAFYSEIGFSPAGAEFREAGIPHQRMELRF